MLDNSVPLEGSLGYLLGRELKNIALSEAPHGLLETACRYISSVLTSDPARVFESVLLPAPRADGLLNLTISIREDFRRNLAVAARNYGVNLERHKQAPSVVGDSASER